MRIDTRQSGSDPRVTAVLVRLQALEAKAATPAPEAPPVQDTGWRDITAYLSEQAPDAPIPSTLIFRVRRIGNIVALNVQGYSATTDWANQARSMPPGFELSSLSNAAGSIAGIGGAQGLRWDKRGVNIIQFRIGANQHARGESHFMVSSPFPDLNNLPGTPVSGS